MKNVLCKSIAICMLTLALSLGVASFVFAADFYLGISQVQNSLTTNEDIYVDNNETVYIPALESGNGYSITWGIEFTRFSLELGFTSSSHDGEYAGTSMDATYNIFDVNFKKFLSRSEHFRPYWLAGLCITSLVVEDGYLDFGYYGYGYDYDDATYTGVGLNIGGGLELKILPSMAFKGEFIYRLVSYSSVSGLDSTGVLDESFDGSGLCFNAGINLYF